MKKSLFTLTAFSAVFASPAMAEVKAQSEAGFLVIHSKEVAATPEQIWQRLVKPKEWWNANHSWSGSTDGFTLDAKAGGCFCELMQEKNAAGKLETKGSVEHMRVIYAQPGKVLRMQGALGPMQSEAVTATFTAVMEPVKDSDKTRITFSYIVGGFMRFKTAQMAPAVDKVLGEQFAGLLKPFISEAEAETPKAAPGLELDLDGLTEEKTAPLPAAEEPLPKTPAVQKKKPAPKTNPTLEESR